MALDEQDKKDIAAMIAAAFTGEDFKKGLGKAIEGEVGKAVKAIDLTKGLDEKLEAKLEGLKAELKPKDPPDDKKPDDKKAGAASASVTDDPEFKKLQSKLAEMEASTKASAKRAEDAEAARKSELLATAVRDALAAGGADPKRLAIALSHLQAKGVVKLDDKGAPGFTFKREWGDEFVAAEAGAKEWLATEEGKFFVPATNKQGTGDGVSRDTPAARKDGKVDWNALGSRLNLSVLESLSDA